MKIKYKDGGKPRRKKRKNISTKTTTSAAQNDKQRRVEQGMKVRREDYATAYKGKDAYLADRRASAAKRKEIREGFANRYRKANEDFEAGKITKQELRELRQGILKDRQQFSKDLAHSSQGYESEADRQGKRENRAVSTINVKKKDGKRITNSTDEANAERMTKTGKDAKKVVERRATKALVRGDKDKRDVSIEEAAATKKKGFQNYNAGGKVDPKKKLKKRPKNASKRDYSRVDPAKLKGKEREEFIRKYAKKPSAPKRPKGFM